MSPGLLDWVSANGCENVDRATANARLFDSPRDVLEILSAETDVGRPDPAVYLLG